MSSSSDSASATGEKPDHDQAGQVTASEPPRLSGVTHLAATVQKDMAERTDEWIHGDEDEVYAGFDAAVSRALPMESVHTFVALFAAEVCALPTPGASGDTMAVDIHDAIRNAVEDAVMPWAHEQWEAHDASACVADAGRPTEGGTDGSR